MGPAGGVGCGGLAWVGDTTNHIQIIPVLHSIVNGLPGPSKFVLTDKLSTSFILSSLVIELNRRLQ